MFLSFYSKGIYSEDLVILFSSFKINFDDDNKKVCENEDMHIESYLLYKSNYYDPLEGSNSNKTVSLMHFPLRDKES
jgi:hypothetical protein